MFLCVTFVYVETVQYVVPLSKVFSNVLEGL
jgi:hypothetical protein